MFCVTSCLQSVDRLIYAGQFSEQALGLDPRATITPDDGLVGDAPGEADLLALEVELAQLFRWIGHGQD